uniref:Uncharacterized protein n=1 Tax=Globodera rostochiensis TaxID=31243 RepID=A0A914GV52_GLORO
MKLIAMFLFLLVLIIGAYQPQKVNANSRFRRSPQMEVVERPNEETKTAQSTTSEVTDLFDRMLLSGMDQSLRPMEEK